MPFATINMATPINSTQSQIFVLPDPVSAYDRIQESSHRKYEILNWIKICLTIFATIFFSLGAKFSINITTDMAINALLGAITIYPIICLIFSLKFYKTPKKIKILNSIISVMLLVLSVIIISSWWQIQNVMDNLENSELTLYSDYQFYTTFRLMGGLIGVLSAVFYASESALMYFEYNNYV